MPKCPPFAAIFIACCVHPSVRCSCSHFTTSRCPFQAARFIASAVQPSLRFSCSHFTMPM
ncbi:hypothetical protein PF005_g3252 [Phytophthora fragariae]|uniref:Uncharacterized protein n=1 Tax=Phytophthora fragariae TaxID=53985 RepID=A0A6A4EGJ0_9STRA|nr:hypothetical protein PF003_g8479 [Phytophthora fragariae]KAE8946933.1 hypothetical protein PF009_g3470 [Phytophthora fragariae]KAE9026365.1 hypothetical protein PF011_g2599 [Phytophthora fragariae]KAE9133498.1 hypothetical protein PF010_g2796 [Phytophthora fragariae]KAE9153246.1 hypothetical protein PF006_g2634 [Phytophthora fragariae]